MFSGSPKNAQPSKTATTGFTYANVETFEGVLFANNQIYTGKAINDPTVTRAANAIQDWELTEEMPNPLPSLKTRPINKVHNPPQIICMADAKRTDTSPCTCLL